VGGGSADRCPVHSVSKLTASTGILQSSEILDASVSRYACAPEAHQKIAEERQSYVKAIFNAGSGLLVGQAPVSEQVDCSPT
jgi:hypothetical protein